MSGIESVLTESLSWESASSVLDEKSAMDIFTALANQQDGLEDLSNQFLQTGIDEYTSGDYEKAAKSFEAAIAISPSSEYNADSTKYLAQTYIELDTVDKAIETYENAVQRDPENDEFRTAAGQLYYSEERYDEAATQYRAAVNVNPSAENRYSYGEALLKVENYSEAEYQFNQVKRLDPDSYAGDYGLGKMYALQEDYEKAIDQFNRTLEIEPTFLDAYAEMGYAYADMGDIESARYVQELLEEVDDSLASTLEYYIDEVEAPEIAFAWSTSSFPYSMSANYPVSAIDSYLENAGAEISMTMIFQFTKEMDASSVENCYNWSISRAESDNIGETYNFGDEIPSTEIILEPYPDYVIYDADAMTAALGFTVTQNETADGTIDPSHILFSFDGEDVYGVSMGEDGDAYCGFSGSA